MEIRSVSLSKYMGSYNTLVYLTLLFIAMGFVSTGFFFLALLPVIYLLVQRQRFGKTAGKVVLVLSPQGIQTRSGKFAWDQLTELTIEKRPRKYELFFIALDAQGHEMHYRYSFNELQTTPEEVHQYITTFRPISFEQ